MHAHTDKPDPITAHHLSVACRASTSRLYLGSAWGWQVGAGWPVCRGGGAPVRLLARKPAGTGGSDRCAADHRRGESILPPAMIAPQSRPETRSPAGLYRARYGRIGPVARFDKAWKTACRQAGLPVEKAAKKRIHELGRTKAGNHKQAV